MAQTIFYKPLATLFSLLCVLVSLHPGASLSWVGTNILKDLESFGTDFNSEASLWTLSSCFSGSGCTKYSYCSGLPILGGYQILGGSINEYYQRVYTGLPPHNQIKVNVTFYPIDSWDSPDYFELQFDTQSYTAWRPYSNVAYTQSYCGSAIYPDYPPINAEIYVPHTGSTLTFRVKSKLDESTIDESLGFRDITIEFLNTNSPSSSICGRVSSGTLDDKVCPCSAGTYMNPPSSGNCYSCNSLCATCTGPNSTQCTSCPGGAILYGGTCIMNTTNNNTGCADPSLYKYQNDSCLPNCPYPFISEWQNGTNFCNAPCSSGSFLYQNGSCLPYCGSGYVSRIEGDITFCDKIYQAQYPCHIGLNYDNRMTTNCSNLDNACAPNHFQYQNGSCILYCIDPFYGILRNASAYCYPPSSFPDVNNTVPGDNGNSTNNITCPSGTYLSGGFCLSCAASCTTCNGPQSCLSCQTGLALLNSSCIPCPSGTYLSGDFCLSCHASCTTCNGPQSCLSCQAGLILINSSCITCPAGQYANPWNSCSYCSTGCEICTDSFSCQSCSSGYILINGTCNNDISIPPNNTDTGNSTNSTNSTYNNGCSGANFYKHQNGSCVTSCPSPFVFSWFNNSAYCNFPCAKGTYLSVNNTCITGCASDETPRIQDYLMFCDKNNTTNSTNSTNSPSVILQIYIRYNISLVDFSSQDGLNKFVQQVAALLGIDPSYIMIVSIREGSTIIESQISIASASDQESMNAAMALAETMGNQVSDAITNNNLNIIRGVSILDHRNSIQVVKTATSSNQIQVSGDSSGSGAIIGLGVGLAVLALVVISFLVYRYKKNLKLKSMRNKENTTKGEAYKIDANMNQTNQEGKDSNMVQIKNEKDIETMKPRSNFEVLSPLEEIDIRVEGSEINNTREQPKPADVCIQSQAKKVDLKSVMINRKTSKIEEFQKEENVDKLGQVDQELRDSSFVEAEASNEIKPEKEYSISQTLRSIGEIDINIEEQVHRQEEPQDQQNENVLIFTQGEDIDKQYGTKQELKKDDDDKNEKPISLGELVSQNM